LKNASTYSTGMLADSSARASSSGWPANPQRPAEHLGQHSDPVGGQQRLGPVSR